MLSDSSNTVSSPTPAVAKPRLESVDDIEVSLMFAVQCTVEPPTSGLPGDHILLRRLEVSTNGKLEMQCLYVAENLTDFLLRKGVHFWELKIQCSVLYVAGTMTEWYPLMGS